jgi:hypothetical protein
MEIRHGSDKKITLYHPRKEQPLMTKMNWARHRKLRYADEPDRALERAASAILRGKGKPRQSLQQSKMPSPLRSTIIHDTAEWRTIGPDCPWNPNPGKRLVFHNGKLVDVMG